MRHKKPLAYITGIFLMVLVCVWELHFIDLSINWNNPYLFRRMYIESGLLTGLETKYGYGSKKFLRILTSSMLSNKFALTKENQLSRLQELPYRVFMNPVWERYFDCYETILKDIEFFPVMPDETGGETLTLYDSWMGERTYGGKRFHEGTDIMTSNNERGYFSIVTMTDGVVEKLGWLEKGGYRIGIRSPSGAYFYYAHLYSYEEGLKEGDAVKAGEIIGKMGDSGYGKIPGTVGNFDVHLHLGIYLDMEGRETSVNPYHILEYLYEKQPNILIGK